MRCRSSPGRSARSSRSTRRSRSVRIPPSTTRSSLSTARTCAPAMLLEVDGVTKVYRGGLKANDDITLGIEAGEVFGLLGPNGAGKTTLIGQILGLLAPTSGTIRIDGVDVVRRPNVAREACSYQPQSSVPIDGLTPVQAIELAGRIRGGDAAA